MRRSSSSRHARSLARVGALALAVACGTEQPARPDAPAGGVEDAEAPSRSGLALEAPAEPGPEAADGAEYFLLEEFDWGDDEEVVEESLLFDPAFACRGTAYQRCRLVKVNVDGEDLLARFHHHEGGLWQAVFLTPDLGTEEADEHLERVWNVLVGYVTRWVGEPEEARPLPDLQSLELGPPQPTHRWEREGLGVRVAVGRRADDIFYVGAFFFDPARAEAAQPAWEAQLVRDDATLRRRLAARAERATRSGSRGDAEPPDSRAGEENAR